LQQACNTPLAGYGTLYDCLYDYALFSFDYTTDGPDCYHITPDLIPASTKFEHDLCFFGDPERCSTENCRVKERTTLGWFADNVWGCPNAFWSGNDVNLAESAPNALCIDGGVYADILDRPQFWSYFGLSVDIVSPEQNGGDDCYSASYRFARNKYGGSAFVDCNYAAGQCALFISSDSQSGTLPTWCDSTGDPMTAYTALPTDFQCLAYIWLYYIGD